MASTTRDTTKSKFYAGLYLRTKTRTHFWGWAIQRLRPRSGHGQPWRTGCALPIRSQRNSAMRLRLKNRRASAPRRSKARSSQLEISCELNSRPLLCATILGNSLWSGFREWPMTDVLNTAVSDSQICWPALPISEWQDTRDTLHMWTQIVGKVRLALTPKINHWWNVALLGNSARLDDRHHPVW